MNAEHFGLSVALTTCFDRNGLVDVATVDAQATRCLSAGCSSLTLFGSCGEGPSLTATDRAQILRRVTETGVSGDQLVIAVFATATEDAVSQIVTAQAVGARGVLLAPPYYFKDTDPDGVVDWFTRVISACGPRLPPVYLYNIPALTGVVITSKIVSQLSTIHGARIAGVKDSAGDWKATQKLLSAFRGTHQIVIGDERHLVSGLRNGAAGAISGMANVAPSRVARVLRDAADDVELDAALNALHDYPVIPALKAGMSVAVSHNWYRVRPPLVPLDPPPKALVKVMLAAT